MSRAAASALYELRTYSLRLERVAAFLRDTERLFHLRTQQSPVLGYWTAELGGLHQVVHLWPYDNMAHRASVRATLAANTEWLQQYVGPVLNPAILSQDNVLMRPVDGTNVTLPDGTGVTELLQLTMRGAESGWLPPLLRVTGSGSGGALIACLRSVVGPVNTAALLIHHRSQDALLEAVETRRHDAAHGDLLQHVQAAHSKMLLPHKVSVIQ